MPDTTLNLAALQTSANTAAAGLAETISLLGKIQAGVTNAVGALPANSNVDTLSLAEVFALLRKVANGLWQVQDDGAGGLIFPKVNIKPIPPTYANNAAAITGGLTQGQTYRTGADPDVLCIVH